MPRTVDEYRQRWQGTQPRDEALTSTSCVAYEPARSTMMGEGCNYFPDFGDALDEGDDPDTATDDDIVDAMDAQDHQSDRDWLHNDPEW